MVGFVCTKHGQAQVHMYKHWNWDSSPIVCPSSVMAPLWRYLASAWSLVTAPSSVALLRLRLALWSGSDNFTPADCAPPLRRYHLFCGRRDLRLSCGSTSPLSL